MEGHAQQQAEASTAEAIQAPPVEGITTEQEPVAPPVTPTESVESTVPRPDVSTACLAGLQAGMLGAIWMLGWLGVSATWQNRSFWTAENLMATAFYGGAAIRPGFARETFAGIALYLLIYSLLGALLAAVVRDRASRARALLVSVIFAMAWYYLSFHLIWKTALPLVALLHTAQSTEVGHLVYGVVLGRFPLYLRPRPVEKVPDPVEPAPVSGTVNPN
jgi:hypothetical protein